MAGLGKKLAVAVKNGGVIELIGDIGAGKTTLTKAIARTLGVEEPVQSPTFTICNRYQTSNGASLAHYDFYRLQDAGIMKDELYESTQEPQTVVVIEWGEIIADVLPRDRIALTISVLADNDRQVEIVGYGTMKNIVERLV